jgi:hypothetical protein
MGHELADIDSDRKIENLLFVIYVQDQRHEYWMKVIREIREALEDLSKELQ